MKKQKAIFIAILLAVSIISSGCIDFDNVKSQIKGLTISENTEKETSDVIVIEDVKTLPVSPVFSDQTVRLYFTIKNKDTERTVENVHVELYDPSMFGGDYQASECSGSCTLPPLSEKTIFFDLTAPSAEQIVNTKTTKRISFKVSYDYESTTIYDVVVVNKDEIDKQQQAGKTVTVNPNKIMGSGPIKTTPDLMGDYSLLSGVTGTVRFIIKNEGTGMLKGNEISAGNFRIVFPYSFSPTGYIIGSSGLVFSPVVTGNIVASSEFTPTGMMAIPTGCGEQNCGLVGDCLISQKCSGVGTARVCQIDSSCPEKGCDAACRSVYTGDYMGSQCISGDASSYTSQKICNGDNARYGYSEIPRAGCPSNAPNCVCQINLECNYGGCQNGNCRTSPATTTTISGQKYKSDCGIGCGALTTCPSNQRCTWEKCCPIGICFDCQYSCVYDTTCQTNTSFEGTCNSDSDCLAYPRSNNRHPRCKDNMCIESCGESGCGGSNCAANQACSCSIFGCSCQADSMCSTITTTTYTTTDTGTSHTVATARPPRVTTSTVPIWQKVQPTKFFTCSGDTCTNNQAIELFDGKSSPMTFALTGNSDNTVYQVYTIKAITTYTYEIIDYIDVEVKPMGISDNAEPGGYS